MRPLLLLVVIGMVGHFIYRDYFGSPETDDVGDTPFVEPAPSDAPIPLRIRVAVQDLYQEWKSREVGEKRTGITDPQKLLAEIKRYLFGKGEHTEAAVGRTINRVLGDTGLAGAERAHVTEEIMLMLEQFADERTSPSARKPDEGRQLTPLDAASAVRQSVEAEQ